MQFLFILIWYWFVSIAPVSGGSKKTQRVEGLRIAYQIQIETGALTNDTAARKKIQGHPIQYTMYLFTDERTGLLVNTPDTGVALGLPVGQRTLMYRRGNKGYKYEPVDSECCIVYKELKGRYKIEKTRIRERFAGFECQKVLVHDQISEEHFAVWYTQALKGSFSPLGIFPLNGVVLKIMSDKLHAEASSVEKMKLPERLFDRQNALELPESAFRKSYIP